MSRDDGFLGRWSRRKTEAQRAPEAPVAAPEPPAAEPEIDLASLPSIDSLTGSSDITMFLKKGVPEALRNAALRQVWASDPAIRDYVGPADYQWDFQTPGAISGFGDLAPGTDVGKLIAEVTEYHLKPAEPVVAPDGSAVVQVESPAQVEAPALAGPASPVPGEGETLARPASAEPAPDPRPERRRHGRATPR